MSYKIKGILTLEEYNIIRPNIPQSPGIYKYYDVNHQLLYVGKAKNIRNRTSQYFLENKTTSTRLRMMVRQIATIEFAVVANENDALILENGLIKEHQPKYNIRLKDDKTYPFIAFKNESFPRVFFTRKFIKDGSDYVGPFTSVLLAKDIFHTIKTIFPLRTCKLNLSAENIKSGKFKVCLEYHIGNCKAPCVGYQDESDYQKTIRNIKDILKGKFGEIKDYMMIQMNQTAEALQFEQAEGWKTKLLKLNDFETKSVIFNPKWDNILAVNIYSTEHKKILNYLKISNGTVVSTKSYEVEYKFEEKDQEIYEHFVTDYLLEHPEIEEVVLSEEISKLPNKTRQVIPLIGDKKKLLDLSYFNARSFAMTLFTDPKFEKKRKEFSVLKELQDKLRLTQLPIHIECFDNSNIQGTHPVSACVVFKQGKPSKKDYRHFHIKTVEGPNDFDSMKEVIYRRYKRMVEEGEDLPQLIIVDGGKGQLSSAIESLDTLGISEKVPIVGIAKRLEEIYFKNDSIPLYIDKKSPALKLIQQLRDEAHRFGLSFHRNLRSKSMITSTLDQIEGLGDKSIDSLYKKYRTIQNMKEAPIEELHELLGKKRTQILKDFFEEN